MGCAEPVLSGRKAMVAKSGSRKKQIVVATVDPEIEAIFARDLADVRFQVTCLRKAGDVLLHILEDKVDLLIVDLDLSGIHGIDLVPIVRRSRPRLPIVVISRDFNYQVRQMVAQEGVTYQIFKPLDMREVSELVTTARTLLA